MRHVIAAILLALAAGPTFAQDQKTCAIPDYLLIADNELPRIATAIKQGRLNIAVVGTGSTLITGQDGPKGAYPARLEASLSKRLPGIAVKVVSVAKSRETAGDMIKMFDDMVGEGKPDLVIWQTGTVDAIRGVQPDEFQSVLEQGIDQLHAKDADVILMNMQFSPRTESMIAVNPYADTMRAVAQQRGALLFDRLGIMRHWSENGQFDLYAASKDNALAKRVHECIGRALASLVVSAAHLQSIETKNTQ